MFASKSKVVLQFCSGLNIESKTRPWKLNVDFNFNLMTYCNRNFIVWVIYKFHWEKNIL